jgi:hypothetical protein
MFLSPQTLEVRGLVNPYVFLKSAVDPFSFLEHLCWDAILVHNDDLRKKVSEGDQGTHGKANRPRRGFAKALAFLP